MNLPGQAPPAPAGPYGHAATFQTLNPTPHMCTLELQSTLTLLTCLQSCMPLQAASRTLAAGAPEAMGPPCPPPPAYTPRVRAAHSSYSQTAWQPCKSCGSPRKDWVTYRWTWRTPQTALTLSCKSTKMAKPGSLSQPPCQPNLPFPCRLTGSTPDATWTAATKPPVPGIIRGGLPPRLSAQSVFVATKRQPGISLWWRGSRGNRMARFALCPCTKSGQTLV